MIVVIDVFNEPVSNCNLSNLWSKEEVVDSTLSNLLSKDAVNVCNVTLLPCSTASLEFIEPVSNCILSNLWSNEEVVDSKLVNLLFCTVAAVSLLAVYEFNEVL